MIQHAGARNAFNFIIFQIGWLLCVIYPGWLSTAVAFTIVGVHLVTVSQHRYRELEFILLGTVIGSVVDGLWFQLGFLGQPGPVPLWVPAWLIGLWAVFMTTLAHSLAWMGSRRWLPFVLAPIAGPFAYWSATRIGPVAFPELLPSLIALAIGWGTVFPALMAVRKHRYPELVPS